MHPIIKRILIFVAIGFAMLTWAVYEGLRSGEPTKPVLLFCLAVGPLIILGGLFNLLRPRLWRHIKIDNVLQRLALVCSVVREGWVSEPSMW